MDKPVYIPGGENYPFNYGLLNLGDLRPLAAVPLAAGLGYWASQAGNQ